MIRSADGTLPEAKSFSWKQTFGGRLKRISLDGPPEDGS
jgi:hypothetical protein